VPAATYDNASRTIAWSGAPDGTTIVTISYTATLDIATTQAIVNTATVTHADGPHDLVATLIANPIQAFLPLVRR
jgi:hypothetical protein